MNLWNNFPHNISHACIYIPTRKNVDRHHTAYLPGTELGHLIESLSDVLDFPNGENWNNVRNIIAED
jgi:hypothetical protein